MVNRKWLPALMAASVTITWGAGLHALARAAAQQDPPALPGSAAPVPAAPQDPGQAAAVDTRSADIIQVASANPRLSTFVSVLQSAGLTEELKRQGPFTVFAPSDSAFARFPKDRAEELTKPENRGKLAALLRYHIVSGKLTRSDMKGLEGDKAALRTAAGTNVTIRPMPSLTVNGANSANVKQTDVPASNGIIHVIDAVLVPPDAAPAAPPPPPVPLPAPQQPAPAPPPTPPAEPAPPTPQGTP